MDHIPPASLLNADLPGQIEYIRKSGALNYRADALPVWCPGCGYFGITHAINTALNASGVDPKNLAIVSGIGCSGRYPFFANAYGFHGVHGRALPVASGVKMANPDLTVLVVGGDGDGLAIGGGHLAHAIRRNVDLTYILFDNGIYGLTKGQSSPTTPHGQVTGTHPYGNPEEPLNPVLLALAYGATFVGAGYAGDPKSLSSVLVAALAHRGFSFVDVISPCITFDHVNLQYSLLRQQFQPVPPGHDRADRTAAMALAMERNFYHGILVQAQRPSWDDSMQAMAAKATNR
jgi:2-oxoglutarate ferredoxin oxidoreductase subunit beta